MRELKEVEHRIITGAIYSGGSTGGDDEGVDAAVSDLSNAKASTHNTNLFSGRSDGENGAGFKL